MRCIIVLVCLVLLPCSAFAKESWERAEPTKTPGGVLLFEPAALEDEFALNEFAAAKKFSGKKILVQGRVRTLRGSVFFQEKGPGGEFSWVELAGNFFGRIEPTREFNPEDIVTGDWALFLCTEINRVRESVVGFCEVVRNGKKELDGYHPKYANEKLVKELGL